MANIDHIYRAYQQRAALISGEDPDGNAIPGHPVNIQVGNTDVAAVSNPVPVDIEASKTIQRAAISVAGAGDNTIVAAGAAGIQTKVLGVILIAAGAVNVRFENGAGGAALTGVMTLAAAGDGVILPTAMPGYHWFETTDATLLNMELSGAVQVSGCIIYYQD